jgi:uncharacterized membrane protein
MIRTAISFLALTAFLLPGGVGAQELVQDTVTLMRAKVVSVESLGTQTIPGTEIVATRQSLTVEVLDGPDAGRTVTFVNDFTQLEEGQVFYLRHITNSLEGTDVWSVADPYRLPVLIAVGLVFLVLLIIFGGLQGVRGFVSLALSLVIIFYLLLPSIYAGYSPILVSISVASIIIIGGSYLTHGVNRTTTSAMLGMLATVLITGAATYLVIQLGDLSGFTSETNAYLNFDTGGRISMIGLLFSGILIGLLGVLYDVAIGQAVAIEELYRAGQYTRVQVVSRAMRIGREHIGAVVNTLAIAYVGAALPLLLLFKETETSIAFILNTETFATEIIRVLMGSIGLILAVPITTFIASRMLEHLRGIPATKESRGHSHS